MQERHSAANYLLSVHFTCATLCLLTYLAMTLYVSLSIKNWCYVKMAEHIDLNSGTEAIHFVNHTLCFTRIRVL